MLSFAVTVFLSSFLLFVVEPMIAKMLLPAFGGTAAVWSTCLVVFQVLLLGGYAYAHLLRSRLSPLAQRWTHLSLLAVSLLFLPPVPAVHLPADTTGTPVWALLRSLLTSIGVPFFALSATAPLLMEWFRQSAPGRSPDRLYAFSNAGSLFALLCYPVVLEPLFARSLQARLWACSMVLFLVVCAVVAWQTRHPAADSGAGKAVSAGGRESTRSKTAPEPDSSPRAAWLWVALPACGSGLLLALTNQLSQDVAPTPLLWVLPMAVYLVTFILCFEGPRSYRRVVFVPASFLSFLALAWLLDQGYLQGFWVQVGGYLSVLFFGCMVCHGEVYRLRPGPQRLTAYYLALSVGGALGGIFVALVAPAIFSTFLETPLLAVITAILTTFLVWRDWAPKPQGAERNSLHATRSTLHPPSLASLATLIIGVALAYALADVRKQSIYVTRSFYGSYRIKEAPSLLLDGVDYPLAHGRARVLLSGQIYHGLQFTNAADSRRPTTYYCEEGGLGLAFRAMPAKTNRNIGAIGLGAGTLAAYAQVGDRLRFYELNPDVLHLAQSHFTFLSNCPAQVDVVLGDGRISLERESPQAYDLLVLDAFAGDSVPMHLLTDEAMSIYQRHLNPEGVMAFHISNSHLDLEPVVRAMAEKHGMTAVLVPPQNLDPREGKLPNVWMLLSKSSSFCNQPTIAQLVSLSKRLPYREPLLWTDDHSSILSILH